MASKFISFLYLASSAIATKDDFRQTTLSELRALPIRIISKDEHIVARVNQILEAKRANPSTDTSALEAEIDLMVYHLYSLTHAEVLLIDPHFGLSEAEYLEVGQTMPVS